MTLVRSEVGKLLFQKRTYIGWAGLAAIPILVAVALNFGGQGPQDEPGGFFALAADNGLLVPLAAISMLATFFLPLVAAMAGGFQLAGEAESGTLKTWLVHPVERGGVVLSKWFVAVVYVFAGLVLVALSSYAAGIGFFGADRFALLSGGTVSIAHGLWLTLLAYLYVGLAMVVVVSLAMLLSAVSDSSLTATIGALVVVIVMQIVGALGFFDFLKPYLFTSYFDTWQGLFQQSIGWASLGKGVLAFVVYGALATAGAWYLFRRKDVLV